MTAERLPDVHGMLLVLGFVGTLIALERAVALGTRWGIAAPALLGLGAVLTLTPAPLRAGQLVLLAGAATLVAVYVPLWRRQADEAVLVQALGAVLAVGAAALWAGGVEIPLLLPWLVGFVVLTIAGERLELARLAMGPSAGAVLVLLSAGLVAGVVAALLAPHAGSVGLGLALAVLVAWLVDHDVARRTVKTSGLPRYMAVCMLAGYAWAAVAAAVWLTSGSVVDGARYDAVVHAVFLGFTISMVMAHAPVILPVVIGRPLTYHPVLLAPVVLLHASLVVRVWLGDGLGTPYAWRVGAVLNIVALLGFLAVAAGRALRSPAMSRGFSPWRDLPALAWLLAIPVVAFAHPWIPEPRWLLLHLLLLGAVTHSIVVWSQHFADTLLHVPSSPRPARLALLNLGALAVMIGTQTARWPVTLVGATTVAVAVVWHAAGLGGQLRRALPARFAPVVRYYVAAAAALSVGATLGVLPRARPAGPLARPGAARARRGEPAGLGRPHGRRHRRHPVADDAAHPAGRRLRRRLRRALPVLLGAARGHRRRQPAGRVAARGGRADGVRRRRPARAAARCSRPPDASRRPATPPGRSPPGCSGSPGAWSRWPRSSRSGATPTQVLDRFGALVPYLAAGFAAQLLLGALGHLVPTALGGGGQAVRAAGAVLDRAGAFRIAAVNLGLLTCLLPAPERGPGGLHARRAARARGRDSPAGAGDPRLPRGPPDRRRTGRCPRPADASIRRRRALGSAVAGAGGRGARGRRRASPSTRPRLGTGRVVSAAAGVVATGHTTTVRVEAEDMRFMPSADRGARRRPAGHRGRQHRHRRARPRARDRRRLRPARARGDRPRGRRAWSAATSTAGARWSATARWA